MVVCETAPKPVDGTENLVKIVLIAGLVLLVVLIIFTLITFATNTTALNKAQQNLEDAITRITSSFQQFASAMFAGLSRFVAKVRDLFVSFLNKVSSAFATIITFITNVITSAFKYVEHLAFQVLTFFATVSFKIEAIIVTFMESITAKVITLPFAISNEIILAFTSLIANAIHTAFCFAVNGITDFANLLQSNVVGPLEAFFTNPNNPVVSAIRDFLTVNVVNPIQTLITDVTNLPTTISNLLSNTIHPLADVVNSIRCGVYKVCHVIPGISCPTNPGQEFGSITIAGITYAACG